MPVLKLNLVAFLHRDDISAASSRLHLSKHKLASNHIQAGHILTPGGRSTKARNGSGATNPKRSQRSEDTLKQIRASHPAVQCIDGQLCRLYTKEREAAEALLQGLQTEEGVDTEGVDKVDKVDCPVLPQLPLTLEECDEVLHSMQLAEARGSRSPVHRLSASRFVVLRHQAGSFLNTFSTSLGYSQVTLTLRDEGAEDGCPSLSMQCNCSQFRNVMAQARANTPVSLSSPLDPLLCPLTTPLTFAPHIPARLLW